MDNIVPGRLVGSEIHGFHTLQDLDVANMMEEAKSRWMRPNEIHAILCNYKYFTISVKPVNLPQSGRIILYDRKMLRNFRKDGHNWKKKNDGKTVKEAHEHLKVGNEERIHVYYAHGQDNPTFVRRCYWLLDKAYEHIVLVHYRETQESQGSPATPVNSNSSSGSDPSAPGIVLDEFDSAANKTFFPGEKELAGDSMTIRTHQMRLHELNTLEWDELVTDDPNSQSASGGGPGKISLFQGGSVNDGLFAEAPGFSNLGDSVGIMGLPVNSDKDFKGGSCNAGDILVNDGLQSQDSFGRWVNSVMTDSPGSVDDALLEPLVSPSQLSCTSSAVDNPQCWGPEQLFSITDIAPAWAYSTDKTKILVTGFFQDGYLDLAKSNLFCVCGDICVPAEVVQIGVYRCLISPHSPGVVNFYLSRDGHKPISQVLNFEYRTPVRPEPAGSTKDKLKVEDFQVQMRLAFLLFSTPKCIDIASNKVSPTASKEGKKFAFRTANLVKKWEYLLKAIDSDETSCAQAEDMAFDLMLKSRLRDWLLERVVGGFKPSEYDVNGQSVIHLCAILGYTWSVQLFSWSGLSLDFRDKFGWTALHWAAYCGREKMVASLLSAGAKPNLVTDPTPRNPTGCMACDLAFMKGYEGLGAYLAEKGLVQQFLDMSIAGNASGSLHASANDSATAENLTVDEMYLKDTLAAYRTAADAAARIHSAFREHSLKIRTRQIEAMSPEDEARNIVAAMKIQHAFRNYETRKRLAAAARIQHRFRTWKMRKEFLNMRQQVIKIQAAFRGLLVRRQYRKICWSVGVLEKAILRWRLKRKGFRGLHVEPAQPIGDGKQESDTEEDFFRISRRQAEDRVERAVVTVQAMFRSKKAQEDYRRMKVAHNEAQLEHDLLYNTEDMER